MTVFQGRHVVLSSRSLPMLPEMLTAVRQLSPWPVMAMLDSNSIKSIICISYFKDYICCAFKQIKSIRSHAHNRPQGPTTGKDGDNEEYTNIPLHNFYFAVYCMFRPNQVISRRGDFGVSGLLRRCIQVLQ
jgi:hypothetical protein